MEKLASASYQARERRLSASAEVLSTQKQLGDQDVEVLTHGKEWEQLKHLLGLVSRQACFSARRLPFADALS